MKATIVVESNWEHVICGETRRGDRALFVDGVKGASWVLVSRHGVGIDVEHYPSMVIRRKAGNGRVKR